MKKPMLLIYYDTIDVYGSNKSLVANTTKQFLWNTLYKKQNILTLNKNVLRKIIYV